MDVSRRAFLFGAVATAATVAAVGTAYGQAAPVLKPFEQNLGNAIGRWTGRVEALGAAANDNAVRAAVTQRLSWLARGAPYVRALGKFAGPAGVVLSIAATAYLIANEAGNGRFAQAKPGTAGDLQELADQLGQDGYRIFQDGSTIVATDEPYGYSTGKYASQGFEFYWQQNSPEPAPGHKRVLWRHPAPAQGQNPKVPWFPAEKPLADVAQQVEAAGQTNAGLEPASVVDALNKLLADAHAASPSTVPDPAQYPMTTADLGTDTWTPGVVLEGSATDRDPALGENTAPNPNPGPDLGTPPTATPIPGLGELPWPDWHIADAPAVASSCTDPAIAMELSSLGLGLDDVTIPASGFCQYGNAAAPFVRPFMLAATLLGCVLAAMRGE